MCRWFAYVSEHEECLLEDVLITPAHSLSKQVHEHYLPKLLAHSPTNPHEQTNEAEITARNRLFNVDGFGIAWYTKARAEFEPHTNGYLPALYKKAQPPAHDLNFKSICADTATKCCFAHIRAATATPIVEVNNHPFVFGRHTFMHNGVVANFISISREMCKLMDDDCYANINGSTDSEHFAALYMTYLSAGKGKVAWDMQHPISAMRAAMLKTIETVISLQSRIVGREKFAASSLNLAATDGSQLVAFRFRNHDVEQPPSLYYSTTAGTTLNRKYPDHPDGKHNPHAHKQAHEHGKHIIVASEPSTYKKEEWDLIEKNHCLMYGVDEKLLVEEVKYPEEWNAKVSTVGF
ncbi:MAG: hypothetical protein MMC33_004056 [Icmadophila ericetorum]|nr:hypothetical protein [Icmadophila ericetorum]